MKRLGVSFVLILAASNSRYGKLNFADWLVFKWKHWSLLIVARRHYHQLCICSHPCGQQRVVTFTKPENVNVRWLLQSIFHAALWMNAVVSGHPCITCSRGRGGDRHVGGDMRDNLSSPSPSPGAPLTWHHPSWPSTGACSVMQCYAATGDWDASCN